MFELTFYETVARKATAPVHPVYIHSIKAGLNCVILGMVY